MAQDISVFMKGFLKKPEYFRTKQKGIDYNVS